MKLTTKRHARRRGLTVAAVGAALALVLAACGGADEAADEPAETEEPEEEEAEEAEEEEAEEPAALDLSVSFRVADGYPPSNPNVVGGGQFFIDRMIEEGAARGIEVEIDYFGDQSLATQAEMFDTIGDGVTDVGAVALSYFAEVVPGAGISELPGRFSDSYLGGQIMYQLIQEELLDEFLAQNMRPLFVMALPPYNLFTIDGPIETPEDVAGLNIRSPGGVCSDSTEAIGANAVQMPVSDQYIALERGTIEGVNGPHSNLRPYQIEEGTNYATTNLALCSVTNMYLVNEDWFQSQPQEIQDLIIDVGIETNANVGNFLNDANIASQEYFVEYGMELNEVDLGPWDAALADVQSEWVERMEGLGIDGQGLIDRWDEIEASL